MANERPDPYETELMAGGSVFSRSKVFSADDPALVVEKIQRAMAGARRVRVADLGADDAEVETESEELAEQLEEQARAERRGSG